MFGSDTSEAPTQIADLTEAKGKTSNDPLQTAENGLSHGHGPIAPGSRTEDVAVTDRMTLTWVSYASMSLSWMEAY